MNKNKTIAKLINASPLLAIIGEEMSFTRAAERLNVDQSAISHRARSLEDALGHRLFDRTTRTLQLTEIGEILCHAAADTVARWDIALDKLERTQSKNLMHLSLPSSLAMKWLIPALPHAQAKDLHISVSVNEDTLDFHLNEADAAIRFGLGPNPGLHTTHLSHCWMQPVTNPSYADEQSNLTNVLTSPDVTLLADRRGEIDKTDFNWDYYFSKLAITHDNIKPHYHFDRADLMLQAATRGMGIGLGRTLLIEDDIKSGYLKTVGPPVRMKSSYWLVCSPSFAETNRFEKLRDWLISEIQTTQ
ncbi:LysR family transcriptional regulator [Pseudomonas sp. HK3]